MTGMECILCNVLWILHLSKKTRQKHNLACRVLWYYWLGNSFLGICVYFCECVWERKRERWTTQIFWERQAIGLLDSEGSSRARTHLSGPIDFSGLQFSTLDTWSPWLPPGSPDQFYPVPKHLIATSVLKSQPNSTLVTCMLSAMPLLSGPQFPHLSHELIRGTALWGCCRIKPVITGKWLEQSVNIKVCTFFLSSCSQRNESWTAHGQRSCKSTPQATLWVS